MTPSAETARGPGVALALMCAAVACFPVMQACVKTLVTTHDMSFVQATWGRYFFHLLLVPLLFPSVIGDLRAARGVGASRACVSGGAHSRAIAEARGRATRGGHVWFAIAADPATLSLSNSRSHENSVESGPHDRRLRARWDFSSKCCACSLPTVVPPPRQARSYFTGYRTRSRSPAVPRTFLSDQCFQSVHSAQRAHSSTVGAQRLPLSIPEL